MVSTLAILFASGLSLFLVWAVLRPGLPAIKSLEDWEAKRHKVDPEVFRILLDPSEEKYLQQALPPREFRSFQRKRLALALVDSGFGGGKCRYVDEARATGENGRKSQSGQGSGGIDPWGASASGKLVAGSALLMAEVALPGLDVIASGGRNAV